MPYFLYDYKESLEYNLKKVRFGEMMRSAVENNQNVTLQEEFKPPDESENDQSMDRDSAVNLINRDNQQDSNEEEKKGDKSFISSNGMSCQVIAKDIRSSLDSWIEHKRFAKFETDPFFILMTEEFYFKLLKHVKSKAEQSATAFISTLESLVTQHYNKIWNGKNKKNHSQEEWNEYITYMRKKLFDKGFITGALYESWCFDESKFSCI